MRIFRFIPLVFLFTTIFISSGCKKNDERVIAEIPFQLTFEIQSGLNTLEDHFYVFNNVVNPTMEILEARSIDEGEVLSIKPKQARMTVQFDNTPLSFLDEVSVNLFSDNLSRKSEAFWTPQISFNQNSVLDIPATLIDAKEFLDQDIMNFELRLDTREVTQGFITCRLDINFEVFGQN